MAGSWPQVSKLLADALAVTKAVAEATEPSALLVVQSEAKKVMEQVKLL